MVLQIRLEMPRKFFFQHRKKAEKDKRLKHQKTDSPARSPLVNSLPSTSPLQQICSALTFPSTEWSNQSPADLSKLQICKIPQICGNSSQPLRIVMNLTINADLSWSLFVHEHKVTRAICSSLEEFPTRLDVGSVNNVIHTLDKLKVCAGQPDPSFVMMVSAKKGKILSPDGSVAAQVDNVPVEFGGSNYDSTIRTSKCEMLSKYSKCSVCTKYRANLRTMYHRWNNASTASSSVFINERYMKTPQKIDKINQLRSRAYKAEQAVRILTQKVQKLIAKGEQLDTGFQSDLLAIMHDNQGRVKEAYPEGSFARLFWDEQLKAATSSNSKQIRWHPVLVKWCLNLKLLSSSAYHALRSTGFIKLPSERTLFDYTHYYTNKVGFQEEVNQQLAEEVKRLSLPDSRKFVSLLIDEMKIKEGLVYNKHSGEIMGFTSLGDINDDLLRLEQDSELPKVAKQLLTIMVRGILFHLNFPYAHFASIGATGDVLFPLVWEAIYRLESSEIKVLCVTADGASTNRKFFRMHYDSNDPKSLYKTKNPYALDDRYIYFVADPPHLIKTVRNCWSHSCVNGTRLMQVYHILDSL